MGRQPAAQCAGQPHLQHHLLRGRWSLPGALAVSWAGRGTKDHMPLNTSASLILQTLSSYARGLRGGQGRGASPRWRREARGAGRGAGTSSQASRPSATPGLAQSRPPGRAAAPVGLCFLVGVVRILSLAGKGIGPCMSRRWVAEQDRPEEPCWVPAAPRDGAWGSGEAVEEGSGC